MDCENLVIARTDSESGKFISSSIDVRDHAFIMGVTEETEPLAENLQALEIVGALGKKIDEYENAWVKNHKLVTFSEAAIMHLKKEGASLSSIDDFSREISEILKLSLLNCRRIADKYTTSSVYFNRDIPRKREGFYHYKAGMEAMIMRAKEFGPYADLLWVKTAAPNIEKAANFGGDIRKEHPGKKLVYNLSLSFNWMGQGFSAESLRSFVFVLQLIALAGIHSTATITCELSRAFKDSGMLAYVNLVQAREKELGCDVLTHQRWSGAGCMDEILSSIQSGSSSGRSMGEGNTEDSVALD